VWLERLSLSHYLKPATEWCEENGADLEEVKEIWPDFCDELNLRFFERRRVELDCTGFVKPISGDEEASPDRPPPDPDDELPGDLGEDRDTAGSRSCWADIEKFEAIDLSPPLEVERGVAEVGERFGPKDDPYTIGEQLGSGATATVYRCTRRGQHHAVKVIGLRRFEMRRDKSKVFERLHRETSILFSLRHSHIVSLYDVVQTKAKLYFVMELVEGGHLNNTILETDGAGLPEHEARYIFLQIVLGLRYIHSKGVAHRDLKPENVLIAQKELWPGLREIKITDFGHSKLVHDGYTQGTTRVGTPEYWAPEVEDSRTCAQGYDERVDLWSLGVVLYVILEGRYPGRLGPGGVVQFRDESKTSKEARDLVRSLMVQRPQDRLSLDGCLRHPWVMLVSGPLSKIVSVFEDVQRGRRAECERRVALPGEPANVKKLRRELQDLTTRLRRPLTLRIRGGHSEVAVCFSDGLLPDADWDKLMRTLESHFPRGLFCRQEMRDLESIALGSALAPILEVSREGDGSTRCPSSANEPVDEPVGESVASGSNCDVEELRKRTEVECPESQEEVLSPEALDAQLEAAKEAYPDSVEVTLGNLTQVPRSLDACIRTSGHFGRKVEIRIIIPEGYPRHCAAQLGALTLRHPRGYLADDTFEAQLRTMIVSFLESPTGGHVVDIAHWLHREIPELLSASDLIRGAKALPLSTASASTDRDMSWPVLSRELSRESNSPPACSSGPSSGPVKCCRICLLVTSHDEQMDARGFPPLERSRNNGTKARASQKESFFSHIRRVCPEVSGILSIGKPAALIAEGPLDQVEFLLKEVHRYPSWKGHVQQKAFAATEPLSDLQKWRVFDGFSKVAAETQEDLRQVLEKLGALHFYQRLFQECTVDSAVDSRKKFSKNKLK
jgi:serine/threonine protein kinase